MVGKKLTFANYDIYSDDLSRIDLEHRAIIDTINPHSFFIAETDLAFRKALESADILLPDGVGIVWACHFLKRVTVQRIPGMDLFLHLLKVAANQPDIAKRRIFFLGASQQTLNKIVDRIKKDYPTLEIGTYSPPYKEVFSAEDNAAMLAEIKKFNPHVLFVGMTAPKQEKWVHENQSQLPSVTICSIGAAFDYYAGTVKRPGAFWRHIGLEWLIRFLREPRRLWKRNLISGPFFVFRVVQLKFNS